MYISGLQPSEYAKDGRLLLIEIRPRIYPQGSPPNGGAPGPLSLQREREYLAGFKLQLVSGRRYYTSSEQLYWRLTRL
jgi:hypothetical protein